MCRVRTALQVCWELSTFDFSQDWPVKVEVWFWNTNRNELRVRRVREVRIVNNFPVLCHSNTSGKGSEMQRKRVLTAALLVGRLFSRRHIQRIGEKLPNTSILISGINHALIIITDSESEWMPELVTKQLYMSEEGRRKKGLPRHLVLTVPPGHLPEELTKTWRL